MCHPENFENTMYIFAHFKDQKPIQTCWKNHFGGSDIGGYVIFHNLWNLQPANAVVPTLTSYETAISKFHGGSILFPFLFSPTFR